MTRFGRTLACFLVFLAPLAARAQDARPAPVPHFRSSEPDLLDALAAGARDSPTFHGLLGRIGASNVVVYLIYDAAPPSGVAARVNFIAAAGGWRYVRIAIDRRYRGCQRLGLLGHELRHVVEIAEAPGVVDAPSMVALYRAIGFSGPAPGVAVGFDSEAAKEAGWQVEHELADRQRGRTR